MSKFNIVDWICMINLACAYALNGIVEESIKILHFLLDENYDLAVLAESDSDSKSQTGIQSLLPYTTSLVVK